MADIQYEKISLGKVRGKDGVDGKTPYIQDGYWYVDGVNTNVRAEANDGADGKTPYIRDGYWYIGETTTGVKAVGIDGTDGTNGVDGKSAYDAWKEQGNIGSEADFLESLKGEPFTYEDFTEEQLEELKGEKLYKICVRIETGYGAFPRFDFNVYGNCTDVTNNDFLALFPVGASDVGTMYDSRGFNCGSVSVIRLSKDQIRVWGIVWYEIDHRTENFHIEISTNNLSLSVISAVEMSKAFSITPSLTDDIKDYVNNLPDNLTLTDNEKEKWREMIGGGGKSAYQIWLDNGNTGTEEDFLNSLKGDVNINLKNGAGDGAIQQQSGKAYAKGAGSVALNGGYGTDADGKESDGVCANGALNIAGGRDTATYQACSYAFGKDCEAGLTVEEFLAKYPNEIDDWGKLYSESWSLACATGLETKAKGRNSHAQNRGTQALANDSSASGVESIAGGANGSNANGFKTRATGEAAFTANNQTVASGAYASAFGSGGEASGKDSFKTGDSNKSQGACTFTMGLNNVASSYCCFVGGKNSETGSAQYTFQYGEGLRTVANNQVVFGTYNVKDSSKYNTLPVFTVGYGTSDSDRKDVFNVLRDGRAKVYGEPKDPEDVLRKGDLTPYSLYRHRGYFTFGTDDQTVFGKAYYDIITTSKYASEFTLDDIVNYGNDLFEGTGIQGMLVNGFISKGSETYPIIQIEFSNQSSSDVFYCKHISEEGEGHIGVTFQDRFFDGVMKLC